MSSLKIRPYARCKIIWECDQFTPSILSNSMQQNFCLESGPIKIRTIPGHNVSCWNLYLQRNRSSLSCYIKEKREENLPCFSTQRHHIPFFNTGVLTEDGNIVHQTEGKFEELTSSYIKIGRLFNFKEISALEKTLLIDKKLTIVIRIEVVQRVQRPLTIPNAMVDQFEKLFNNEKYKDFKIYSGDEEFFVHKNILSIRSPVLNTMMETNMLESKESKVTITDISSRALREFLRFVYCGKVEGIDELASELLYAATKYDLQDLKPMCVFSLAKMISLENVIDTMVLADLHGEDELRDFCIDFIKWHYEKVVESKTTWNQLPQSLYKKILDAVLLNESEPPIKIMSRCEV